MARMRLGVALLLPEPARTEVDALRRAVADGSLGRVPAHLTLVPPVNVHERDLDAALLVLRDAASSSPPLTLALGPPASFLPANPVLFLEASGDLDALERLRAAVFRPPLERPLAWPYVPHVTLCDEGDPARVQDAVRVMSDYRATVTFGRLHLLREEERVWVPFADAALGGRRVVGRGGLELEITEGERPEPDVRTWVDTEWARYDQAHFPEGERWDERPFVLTARREGGIVGAAIGWTNRGVGYLGELVVGAGERRTGVGSHLLAAFEDLARRRGATRLALRTNEGLGTREFYEGRGWQVEASAGDWVRGTPFLQLRKDL